MRCPLTAPDVQIRQTGAQLWLNHFQNDTVAMALSFGKLKPAMQMVSFFVTPLVGGLSASPHAIRCCLRPLTQRSL